MALALTFTFIGISDKFKSNFHFSGFVDVVAIFAVRRRNKAIANKRNERKKIVHERIMRLLFHCYECDIVFQFPTIETIERRKLSMEAEAYKFYIIWCYYYYYCHNVSLLWQYEWECRGSCADVCFMVERSTAREPRKWNAGEWKFIFFIEFSSEIFQKPFEWTSTLAISKWYLPRNIQSQRLRKHILTFSIS